MACSMVYMCISGRLWKYSQNFSLPPHRSLLTQKKSCKTNSFIPPQLSAKIREERRRIAVSQPATTNNLIPRIKNIFFSSLSLLAAIQPWRYMLYFDYDYSTIMRRHHHILILFRLTLNSVKKTKNFFFIQAHSTALLWRHSRAPFASVSNKSWNGTCDTSTRSFKELCESLRRRERVMKIVIIVA